MRYDSNNPDSLDLIQNRVGETFEEINITLDNLRTFWQESLLPHLENEVAFISPTINLIIIKLYLTLGRHFWTRVDFK